MSGRKARKPRTNDEWSEATIRSLIRTARSEFARLGYAQASVERIAEEAGLTKGAVYYHFASKEGLFEAVLRAVQGDIVQRIEARAIAAPDPISAVVAGCEAFVDVALDEEVRRIALADGPRVLGWSTWRTIDGEFGLGSLKQGLRECRKAGLLEADPDALAHLISGALNEAVFLIAESDSHVAQHAKVRATLRSFLKAVLM